MRKSKHTEIAFLHIDASHAAGGAVLMRGGDRREGIALEVLIPGPAVSGPALTLTAPISFWGGVDPKTSVIADVRHPQHGIPIAGTILTLPGTIGSSSASAVLLELIHRGIAPAAIILHAPDAILLLGVLAAREMGWGGPGAYRVGREPVQVTPKRTLRTGSAAR
jgi:uncharacterized protein